MNLALLIPDGVGVRNFVLGTFLKQASQTANCQVLHSIPDSLLPAYQDNFSAELKWERLIPYRETPLSMTLRYALAFAHMQWVGEHGFDAKQSAPTDQRFLAQANHSTNGSADGTSVGVATRHSSAGSMANQRRAAIA